MRRVAAPDGAPRDDFGQSVALAGDISLVGASSDDSSRGAVYAFTRSGRRWGAPVKFVASDPAPDDYFGWDVALSGDSALVGAIHQSPNAPGAAYVFARSGAQWTQQSKLLAGGTPEKDTFGYDVAIDGDTALIGAPGASADKGAAYVFTRSGAVWTPQATLVGSDVASGDYFGLTVALVGDTAFVAKRNAVSDKGAVYVFTRSAGAWTQRAVLTSGAVGGSFGVALAASGDTLIVGTFAENGYEGAAYVFRGAGATWTREARLVGSDHSPGFTDWFGRSVALSGDTALVGAPVKGVAYYFTRSAGAWTERMKLSSAERVAGDWFGLDAALADGTALVGGPSFDLPSDAGAAYVFAGLPKPPLDGDLTGTWTGSLTRNYSSLTAPGAPRNERDAVSLTITQTGDDLTVTATITPPDGGAYQIPLQGRVGNRGFWMSAADPTNASPFVVQGQVAVGKRGALALRGFGVAGTAGERAWISAFNVRRSQ